MNQSQLSFASLLTNVPSIEAREASKALACEERHEGHGAIYTRDVVVDFMLDLAEYTADQALYLKRVLEPSFGSGDFLHAIIHRLVQSWRTHKASPIAVSSLKHAICAVELHQPTFQTTKKAVIHQLTKLDVARDVAKELADHWLTQGDFLLTPVQHKFDLAVGNPPYVRSERIPRPLLKEYRGRYTTMRGRADLYIPFFERALRSLKSDGALSFICTDRWIKNQYGAALRKYIHNHFGLSLYVNLTDLPAFRSDVVAYPAIFQIEKNSSNFTRVAHPKNLKAKTLQHLANDLQESDITPETHCLYSVENALNNQDPWLLDAPRETALIRRLEKEFPVLQDVGCKVGIGVATGADKLFIGPADALDVEQERLLPLLKTEDIRSGTIKWQGLMVINPFDDSGKVINLDKYPRLKRYFWRHKEPIQNRYCAKKNPAQWYRTIDRIHPTLVQRPKLLIPDIKNDAPIVYDAGRFYPHHNLYYVVSDVWDLKALQAVLSSKITDLFIGAYSTKMRGGFLRYQAQYLRRIRLPAWANVAPDVQAALVEAGERGDPHAIHEAVLKLYRLNASERKVFEEM